MKKILSLTQDDASVRTQITLTEELRRQIEEQTALTGESLSEYLRQAALARLRNERDRKQDLEALAQSVVGCVQLEGHSEWQDAERIDRWVDELREEWT